MDLPQRYFSKRGILVQMRLAHRAFARRVRPYALPLAYASWFSGSFGLAMACGLGGTVRESVAGGIILANELYGALYGKRWSHYLSFSSSLFWSCLCLQRWPELAKNPSMALLMTSMVAVNLPLILKPFVKDKAVAKFETFVLAGKHLVQNKKSRVKSFLLRRLANPACTALYSNLGYFALCVSGILADRYLYGDGSRMHLLYAYPAWIFGNQMMRYIEKPITVKSILGAQHRRESQARPSNFPKPNRGQAQG